MQRDRSKSDAMFLAAMGLKIRKARKAAKLTQQEVADLIPMHRSGLSHIEMGKNAPLITTLKRIAEVLNNELIDLLR